jgi:hypothetical protein
VELRGSKFGEIEGEVTEIPKDRLSQRTELFFGWEFGDG